MSLRNTLHGLLSALEELKSLRAEAEAAYASFLPLGELIKSPPAGIKMPQKVTTDLDKAEAEYHISLSEMAILEGAGDANEQFDALQRTLAELESPAADGAKSLLDGLYHRMNIVGVAEGQSVSRKAREEVIRAETRVELLDSLRVSLPADAQKLLPATITTAQEADVKAIRESLEHLDKFRVPGDLRDRLKEAQIGVEMLKGAITDQPEQAEAFSKVRNGLARFAEGIDAAYDFASNIEVLEDLRKRILAVIKSADVRRLKDRLPHFAALDARIAAPGVELRERIQRMLNVAAEAEALAD
jgi:hypothetical protein